MSNADPTGDRPLADEERGLYGKYHVERVNDPTRKHAGCFFYVLDMAHDRFSIPALAAYAEACEAEFPRLAYDLWGIVAAKCDALQIPVPDRRAAPPKVAECAEARPEDEILIREFLWLSHGHPFGARYGDDGEMQCQACGLRDYKRLPLAGLIRQWNELRLLLPALPRPSAGAEERAVNVCEHGDHPAPEGKRFCSVACSQCEHESHSDSGCDGICGRRP